MPKTKTKTKYLLLTFQPIKALAFSSLLEQLKKEKRRSSPKQREGLRRSPPKGFIHV